MRQCTTSPQKRRRTQEALIREGDKSDAVLCIELWKRCRRTTPDLSIREFAKRIGEEESTVRNILNKGTTAGRLTYWLPDQKKRGYFDLSPAFAAEEPKAGHVEEPPMTEQEDEPAPHPEAEVPETDTVPVDETEDEGEALTGEGALGEEPEAAQPEQQPEAVQPQAETPPPPPQGERKPRKGQVQQGEELRPEQAEAGKKPAGAMSVAEAILDKHPVVEQIPVEGIEVNKAIRQFKRGADLKTGVVPESRLEGQWSGSLGRAIRVIEFKDGRREVITGRHRLDLARRNGMATIPAIVYREADGMTVEKAHALDAIENVMDGKGTTRDYIRFFAETSDLTDAELRDLGVTTSNNERVRNAFDIARKGIDELRVEALNAERIPLSVLGAIARSDKRVQLALLDDVRKHDTRDPTQVMMMGKLLAQGIQNGETEQLELFGEDDEAMRDMRALAIGVARVTSQMRKDLSIVRGVINKEKDVVLRDETAKRLGITDKNDMAELHQAKERLEQEIREYESPTISGERREKALAAGREAIKREEAHGVQGTLDFSGGQSKPAPRPEPKPEKKPESPKPTPQAKPKTEPMSVSEGTARNGRIAWRGKWLKPGGIHGHQGVFVSDTEDGEPHIFYQTEDWGLGSNETKRMRRGTSAVDHYRAAVTWKDAGMPGLDEAKAQLPVEEVDGAVSEDGYIRWEKFWLKPGTHDGQEGYFIHDERGGKAMSFYKPGPWKTKNGKVRPGKVTNFVDDKLTGERVNAVYRWVKHEKMLEEQKPASAPGPKPQPPEAQEAKPATPAKPKVEKTKAEQESKPRPFEDSGIINQDALKDPETLNTVERIFANTDERAKEAEEPKPQPPEAQEAKPATPAKPKVEGSKETQAALGELTDLMSDLGMAREPPETLKHPRTGMLREGPELTPDQRTKVQNAMNKVIASSVKNDGVRTFRDLVRLLFGMLRDTNRKMWEAMKLFLRNAWNQYGDEHDTLGLDEVSRAEARAIFDEVERGESETTEEPEGEAQEPEPTQAQQPAQEPEPQAEHTPASSAPQPMPVREYGRLVAVRGLDLGLGDEPLAEKAARLRQVIDGLGGPKDALLLLQNVWDSNDPYNHYVTGRGAGQHEGKVVKLQAYDTLTQNARMEGIPVITITDNALARISWNGSVVSPQAEPTSAQESQASTGVIKPTEADYANAKDGDVIKAQGENGKRAAVIKWGEYWLEPAKRTVKVWVQERRGRGHYEQQEREGVNIHGRARDGRPIAAVYSFWEPRDEWTSSKGKTHYGYLHDIGGDMGSWSKWNALDAWGERDMPGLEEARAWMAGAMPAGSGTLGTETQGKETDNGGNVSTEPVGQTSGDSGLDGQTAGGVGDPDGSNAGSGGGQPAGSAPSGVSPELDGNEPAPDHATEPGGVGGGNAGGGTGGGVLPTPGAQTPVQPEGSSGGVGEREPTEPSAGGNGGRGAVPGESGAVPDETPSGLKNVPARNYVIPENGDGGIPEINTKAKRIAANLAALRLLKTIGERNATPEEQRVLSLYSGWGNLGQEVFDENNPDYQAERDELKSLLSEEEYATARQSTQYAHYTPVYVIRAIYDTLGHMGLKGDNLNVFEAGIGSGRFIGALPPSLRGSRYAGVEMDDVSIRLLKKLYPQAEIGRKRYEEVPARHGTEDLAVGNPPYGNIKPYDKTFRDADGAPLHNFFIMKQIEALRPGGIGVFVVSKGFLDNRDARWREWIHKRAQMVAALRLPSATFWKGANTDVVTDIVIFRKRFPNEPVPSRGSDEARWLDVVAMDTRIRSTEGGTLKAAVNAYFTNGGKDAKTPFYFNTDKFLGYPAWTFSTRRDKNGAAELTVRHNEDEREMTREAIAERLRDDTFGLHNYYSLAQDMGKLFGYSPEATTSRPTGSDRPVSEIGGGGTHPSLMPGGNFIGKDGKLYYAIKSTDGNGLLGRPVKPYNARAEKAEYDKHPVKKVKEKKDSKGRVLRDAQGKPILEEKIEKFDRWRHVPYAASKLTPDEAKVMAAYTLLREARYNLVQAELSGTTSDEMMSDLRKRLNEAYDNFLKAAHGFAKQGTTTFLSNPIVSRLLSDDPASSQVLGLELPKFDEEGNAVGIQKSAIFDHRVNFPGWEPLKHYDSAVEALVANINVSGMVDLGWIADRTGKTPEAVMAELGDRVFIDPETGRYELKEMYLSGDVKTKLAVARKRVEAGEEAFQKNVEALEAVQPQDVPLKDIYIPIGSSLTTPRILSFFALDMLGVSSGALSAERNDLTGQWMVSLSNSAVPLSTKTRLMIGDYPLRNIIKAALNNRTLDVKDRDGKTDPLMTKYANDAVAEVKSLWRNWWKTSGFEADMAKAYNDTFNRIAEATYDGSVLRFDKLPVNLYKHQRDAIWRAILTRHVYFNHVVGAGKTNAAIVSVMEMKRMGIVKKPIIVVPNHLVGQWQTDILTLYPNANVLATGNNEYSAQNRKRTMARIQNGDFDAIIVPQSPYTALMLSADAVEGYYERMIAALRQALEQASQKGKKKTVAEIEARIEKLKAQMKKHVEELRKNQDDTGIFFDTLGLDCLVVDEAHDYKNVGFSSGVKAKGLGNAAGSDQARDMMMKVSYLRTTRPNVPLIMMSGTPVSNSLTELFHVIQFVEPGLLANAGIFTMDGFLEAFGVVETRMEPDATGVFKDVIRLRQLENVGDLMKMVRSFMDYIGAEGLQASMEAVGAVYKVPKAETIIVTAKRSPAQDKLFGVEEVIRDEKGDVKSIRIEPEGSYMWRAQNIRALWPEDNMLAVTTDSVNAAMDARLRDRSAPDFPGSKVNLCVNNVLENYRKYDAMKGTQMIFCDLGVPPAIDRETAKERLADVKREIEATNVAFDTAVSENNHAEAAKLKEQIEKLVEKMEALDKAANGHVVYFDIRDKLIAQGVPADEIAFMQDYKKPKDKSRLFKRMNEGKVRVLIGSSETMGTGVNANRRMVALHHLDVPWRPSDLEQRNGRIIRQGNVLMDEIPGFKVQIYEYVTERTADTFKWTQVKNKLEAFHNIWKAKPTDRRAEEIDEDSLNAEDVIAAGMANPFQAQSVNVKRKRVELEDERDTYYSTRSAIENAVSNADAQSEIIRRNIERSKKVQELAKPREKDPKNWYAGISVIDYRGKEKELPKQLVKNDKDASTLAKTLNESYGTIFYRGFEWKLYTINGTTGGALGGTAMLQMFEPGGGQGFSANNSKLLGSTGAPFDIDTVQDDGLVTRMDNAIKRLIEAIPKLEDNLKQNAARMAKNQRELEAMPEKWDKEDVLDTLKREEQDLSLIYMNRIYNVPDARKRLAREYGGEANLPDYTWLKPGFVEKPDPQPPTPPTQTGTLREPPWERKLREDLEAKGLTESDLSPETQAYLRAKREREAVLPQGGLRGAVDKLGDLAGRREGESHWDYIKRKSVAAAELVDKKLVDVRAPLIKAQRQIVGEEVELAEDEDIAKAMSLSYGRIVSRHADIDRDFVKPAMKLLSQNGLDVSDLDLYLQATFAPERNRMIRERAEWKDAGAGISDEEAAMRLKGMRERLTATQWQALKEAAGHIYRMNRANLKRLAESGILAGEQVAEWLKLSPHYVPLRDDLERLGVEEPGTGGGLRKGGPFRKAVGRYSEAMDSSVGWSVIQAKQGVIWAEQNRIARVTLNFAQNHRSPDDYFVGKVPLKAEKVFKERKGYKQEDAMALRLDKPAERNLAEQYLKAGYTVVRSSENRNVVWVDAGVRSVGGRVGWAWRNTCTRR